MTSNFIKSVALLCVSTTLPLAALAQKTAPPPPMKWEKVPETRVTVDGSEAMFTTMCALLAAGYEANVSAEKWSPMRAQLRDRLQHQQGPAVEVLRNFYQQHELADPGAMLSRYIWFGLVSGPAPDFKPNLRRDELPPEVIALEGFQEILAAYYKEQKIGELWRPLLVCSERLGCLARRRCASRFSAFSAGPASVDVSARRCREAAGLRCGRKSASPSRGIKGRFFVLLRRVHGPRCGIEVETH